MWSDPGLAWPHIDEDGAAIAQKHYSEEGGAGGGLLRPRGGGDVQHCNHNEDIGDHGKHGGQNKEQMQEEVEAFSSAGVRAK